MIHQHIFAAPKPGMTEAEFQRYWKEVHAVNYASKIPQIRKYLIASRLAFGDESKEPLWSGMAEIWLENEKEQIESLQSKEFLQGARLDEPNWAAFWRSVVIDTDTHVLMDGPKDGKLVKVVAIVKRKAGLPLETFRNYSLQVHGALDLKLPGLRRYEQCMTRDGWYTLGEPMFDCISHLWFDNVEAISKMLASPENAASARDLENFIELKYAHVLVMDETWIIGPQARTLAAAKA